MPHRKNAKGDIGGLKRFSDTYDMDNVYLSEEGWVYRHFKNSERTLWWDEILVAGQVKPGMEIHKVNNNPVVPTNPYKLGTAWNGTDGGANDNSKFLMFETGDGHKDYRYSDHERAEDKVTEFSYKNATTTVGASLPDRIDFQETAWSSINVEDPEYMKPDETQVPKGWSGVSSPSDVATYPDEPPYTGEAYENINHYTIAPDSWPAPYNGKGDPAQKDSEVIVGVFADDTGPAEKDEDYKGVDDAYGDGSADPTPPVDPEPEPPEADSPYDGIAVQQ